MKRIYLIQCSKGKLDQKAKATELYTGILFRKMLLCAKQSKHDAIFILSSKHCLLKIDDEVDPYDDYLGSKSKNQRIDWSNKVIQQLSNCADLQKDIFVILASAKYREFLIPHMRYHENPLQGMRIGEQMHYLNQCAGI